MAILGTLLKKGITLRESLDQLYASPFDLQKHELRKLLIQCKHTEFGTRYGFEKILKSFKSGNAAEFYEVFRESVPIHTYEKMYRDWWHIAREGHKDVCWPGRIRYFALSSGTTEGSSKYIPISRDMMKSIRKTSIRQILTIAKYDLADSLLTKAILMLGGSTDLRRHGHYFEGDLSGITTSQIPFWFQHFYKPGKRISKTNWSTKLDEITQRAPEWDIGIICGVPAWLQLMMEKIINHYRVENIHEIWPNLSIFVHGGVPFEPYRKGFSRLLGRELIYMETYLASEGFLAFQSGPDSTSMRMVLNNGVFYEFIPFTSENFSDDGELSADPRTLRIDQVEEDRDYALLISTNAGAWRYLIGDVIRFTDLDESEIVITGRTKLFLSLCGEHLSLDNINKAVELVEKDLNLDIREFTVVGEEFDGLFAHRWYIGTDEEVDETLLRARLDHHLKALNDDYATERNFALRDIMVQTIPIAVIYEWMRRQNKMGASNKFPRVLKKEKAAQWKEFVASQIADHGSM